MADAVIRIRFVRHRGFACGAIVWRSGMVGMPFIPTHAECITPDDLCVGQFGHGGMQARPRGYDREDMYVLPDGRKAEIIVNLPCTQAQADDFYSYMMGCIGEPYDWSAPWGFLFPGHHHTKYHSVCSAKVAAGLRHCGYFPYWLTVPFHLIDPRDLMMILSSHVEIPH